MAKKLKNLYWRGNILYMKFTFLGHYVHKSTFTDDPKLAQLAIEKAQKEIYEANMSVRPKAQSCKFSQAIEDTYKERWASNNTGDYSYKQAQTILELLGDIEVSAIDTKKVREVQTALRVKFGNETTVNRYMAAFRTAVRHACESHGWSPPKFTLTKEANGRIRVYTHYEEAGIIRYFRNRKDDEMADITAFLMDTGFRLSECLGIGKRDEYGDLISEVDLERGKVSSWKNKGAKPRTIPMTSRVWTIMKSRGSDPWTLPKNTFENRWRAMRIALHLDDESVAHACRHTCASRLLASGKSLLVVQKWLGHADIKTTMIYLHLAPGELDDAVKGLEPVNESVTESVTTTDSQAKPLGLKRRVIPSVCDESGLPDMTRNQVYRKVPRVRIPISPPLSQSLREDSTSLEEDTEP